MPTITVASFAGAIPRISSRLLESQNARDCVNCDLDSGALRALQRIERHIRQQTLPDVEILNMAGRTLALITSGAFAQSEGFVERKRQQVSDMADRLEKRLSESQPEGEWEKAMQLIRQMCG